MKTRRKVTLKTPLLYTPIYSNEKAYVKQKTDMFNKVTLNQLKGL